MACPYFEPLCVNPAPLGCSPMPVPLGDPWTGTCRAAAQPPAQPDADLLHSLCHFGYARGRCPRFAADDPGPDAVRFAITRVAAPSLDLCYVLERDHHPFAHGSLSYSLAAGCFLPSTQAAAPPEIVVRQAEAYVKSYLRREPEAYRS